MALEVGKKDGSVFYRVENETEMCGILARFSNVMTPPDKMEYPVLTKVAKGEKSCVIDFFSIEDIFTIKDEDKMSWYYNMFHGFTAGIEPNG